MYFYSLLGELPNDLLEEYAQLKEKLIGSCRIRGGGGPSLTQM